MRAQSRMSDLGELIYFPVMAKGLQLACLAEMSGLPWTGFTVEDEGPKSWGEIKASGIAPFGQMPLLKTPSGLVLGQSVAIANYIAKMAGPALEGESDNDYALSQMLMAEAEDIYSLLGSCELANWKTPEQREAAAEKAKTFFGEQLPAHLKNLEGLARSDVSDEGKHSDCRFTSSGHTAGEIYLLGMLHQAVLAGGGLALRATKPVRGGAIALYYPRLVGWCKFAERLRAQRSYCVPVFDPQPSLLISARRRNSARTRRDPEGSHRRQRDGHLQPVLPRHSVVQQEARHRGRQRIRPGERLRHRGSGSGGRGSEAEGGHEGPPQSADGQATAGCHEEGPQNWRDGEVRE